MKKIVFFIFSLLCVYSQNIAIAVSIKHTGNIAIGYAAQLYYNTQSYGVSDANGNSYLVSKANEYRGNNNFILSGEYDLVLKTESINSPLFGILINANAINIFALEYHHNYSFNCLDLFNFSLKFGYQITFNKYFILEPYVFFGLNVGSQIWFKNTNSGTWKMSKYYAGIVTGVGFDAVIKEHFLIGIYYMYSNMIDATKILTNSHTIGAKLGYKF